MELINRVSAPVSHVRMVVVMGNRGGVLFCYLFAWSREMAPAFAFVIVTLQSARATGSIQTCAPCPGTRGE